MGLVAAQLLFVAGVISPFLSASSWHADAPLTRLKTQNPLIGRTELSSIMAS